MKNLTEVRNYIRKIITEWYDEEYFEKPKALSGIGNLNDIDWQLFHETLVANKEYFENNESLKGNPNYIPPNTNDLIGHDGMMSKEELNKLEEFGLFYIHGAFPIIEDEYLNYETFFNKVKEIWDKETPIDNNLNWNESPYLRGNETDGG